MHRGGKPFGDVAGASGTWSPVTDPATGEVTTRVAMAGADEVDAAVAAAKEADATWPTSPLARRIAILVRCRELLDARRDDIAALITAEQGRVDARPGPWPSTRARTAVSSGARSPGNGGGARD
ncbi:aldehyde dehydrogenase family protein [Streptomyces sp. SID8377]|nr:aldehyde dehydrogenase family protein [Streptomyces sp. SID8377]